MRRILSCLLTCWMCCLAGWGQINTDRVLSIGRNALYFEDYVLSIQYFNEVIKVKPYLPEPYLYRSIAKLYLDDYGGADEDASCCIERNPFIVTAYQVRGLARLNRGNYPGAVEDFESGLKMQPENRTFLRHLAIAYAQQKDFHRADSCFTNLISLFPSEAVAYLHRAQLRLDQKDSIRALNDLNKALELDKSSAYAFALRSMIYIDKEQYDLALTDIDMAVKLDPDQPAYYINRGLVRYNLYDIRGALDDYDFALGLDSESVISLYNRALLRAQIGDRNRAIDDFSGVLALEPDNTFAAYNRALLRDEVGDYRGAIADYTQVFEAHPNFFPALYARAEDYKNLGNNQAADEDFRAAFATESRVKQEHRKRQQRLAELKKSGVTNPDSVLLAEAEIQDDMLLEDDNERTRKESERNIRKFNRIMSSNIAEDGPNKYSSSIRGRIQDKHFVVELQPLYVLTYYEKSDEVRQGIYFEKTISDFNRAGLLSRRLKAVCNEQMLSQAQVQAHFASIDDYSRLLDVSPDNIVALFGRSLDFMLVQDYQNAIEDLNMLLLRQPKFILAYFNRAVLRLRLLEISEREQVGVVSAEGMVGDELKNTPFLSSSGQRRVSIGGVDMKRTLNGTTSTKNKMEAERLRAMRKLEYEVALRDLDMVLKLSPTFVYAYFNRAYVCAQMQNYDAALSDFNRAIELYPRFAEAYFNRGLIYLRTGKTAEGMADLSKAGEYGLVGAYSVLKRAASN